MLRYRRRFWVLAASLAALAGYVDAIGYLRLGGVFVSFMSGNSTQLAIGFVLPTPQELTIGGIIAAFVGGVSLGTIIGHLTGRWRQSGVLACVATLLVLAGLPDSVARFWSPLAIAAAMGAENAIFRRDGEVSVGVTYVTGTLVKLGQHIATALMGGPSRNWMPFALLWIGLIAGGTIGALAYRAVGFPAIWGAAAMAMLAAIVIAVVDPQDEAGGSNEGR